MAPGAAACGIGPPLMHALFMAPLERTDKPRTRRSTARIAIKWRNASVQPTDRGDVRRLLAVASKRVARYGFEIARCLMRSAGAIDICKDWQQAAPGQHLVRCLAAERCPGEQSMSV